MGERRSDDSNPNQEARIKELMRRAHEAAGGEMVAQELHGIDPDVRESFWARVVAFESAPNRPLSDRFTEAGIDLPLPEALADSALSKTLWMLIHKLAEWRCLLCFTNHLSDRQLYRKLVEEVLSEPQKDLPPELGYDTIIDISEYESDAYLRYYADERTRAEWAHDFPAQGIPPHEDPPYDRDRHLPGASEAP